MPIPSEKTALTPASRFAAMDGLRGVAALMILAFHFSIAAGVQPPAASAYLAVDLFFMLSGFVIALAYEHRLLNGLSVRAFAWVRIVRLYPLAVLGTIVSLLALLAPGLWPRPDPARIAWLARDGLKALLFIPHLRGDNTLYPLNPPMWSLLFEIAINLAYAAALPWLSDRRLAVLASLGGVGVIASAAAFGNLDVGATTATFGGGWRG